VQGGQLDAASQGFNHKATSRSLHDHLVSRVTPAQTAELSAAPNILLSAFKLGVGSASGSQALVADGMHTFSDLAVDVFTWATVRLGARPPDATHPHGYGHYEHIGSIGVAGMLVATGTALSMHSGADAIFGSAVPAAGATEATMAPVVSQASVLEFAPLLVALVSTLSKELLFRVTLDVGRHRGSPSTVANAYQIRSDALSSIIVLFSIAGAMQGCSWLDPLAASVVGVMMSAVGIEIARDSWNSLRDQSLIRESYSFMSAGNSTS
jgi:cation diffusion facilitator family transporter